jgi:ABC-type transporter Mla maintaining outer membrane lipid asymmetry ATPase subunit MlaF
MLADGKLIASGTLTEVRASPDPRVQAFFRRELLPQEKHRTLADELEWRG